jgi:hypothetical protein
VLRPDFRTGQSRLLVPMGEVDLLAGRAEEARRFADLALARAREHRQRGDEALSTEQGMRPLIAHWHLGLGKLYRRTDKREQAQEHLATATTMYREMGMTYWLEKAEAAARDLG